MADGAGYQAVEPPLALRPFVRLIWTYEDPAPSQDIQLIPPDGCPELVIDLASASEEQTSDGCFIPQPSVIMSGQLTRPMRLRATGPLSVIGARFEPDGARDFLGCPLSSLTDQRLDLTGRLSALMPALLAALDRSATLILWLEDERQRQGWSLDQKVRSRLLALDHEPGLPDLDLAQRRQLQRRFLDRVGVSERSLKSVQRFRRVFDHAEAEGSSWLEAGLKAGYFDQPQMARDFQRFLGCTATQWARDQVELARRLTSQTYKTSG